MTAPMHPARADADPSDASRRRDETGIPSASVAARNQFPIAGCRLPTVKSVMPLHVLIVPDKFKGTLSAQAAADLIARGWREARPQDTLELLPMSDGGDGFGEVLGRLLDVQEQTVATLDA